MNERQTPETDAEHAQFAMGGFTLDFCRKLECERDEAREALSEIALYLSVGIGDETITAQQYQQRILEGIKTLTEPIVNLWKQAEEERDEAREKENIHLDNFLFAQRDIFEMREAIIATLEENRHLADGDDCTLAKLKSVVPEWK